MAIEIIDGFKVIHNVDGDVLGIEMSRLEDCLGYAIKNGFKKIFVESVDKCDGNDVEFFKEYSFFTGLTITASNIDISAIHHLRGLKYLNVFENNQKIDFSSFPILEEASIDWNNKLLNLDECKYLKKLTLWKFKPKSKSFSEIRNLISLNILEIAQSNVESLDGIEGLKNLESFEASYLSKLTSLNGIESLKLHLKSLILKVCKKLRDYDQSLAKMHRLEKLILSDCGELDNINFLRKLNNLKFFSFVNTNIKDGNLLPLIEQKLDYAGFDDKKHYSHKMKQINPTFSWKG
jgi:hypothetical protein